MSLRQQQRDNVRFDSVGNLADTFYPIMTTSYAYDKLNRLTQVNSGGAGKYVYTLGAAGNRQTVAELSGRTVNYGYDALYRLTSETVTADPAGHNFTDGYVYDNVGNRQQLVVNGVTANAYTYDADDRLGSDQYDANGNTTLSLGTANTYDFENRMLTHGNVSIVYDGDGNRVAETAGGVTTQYLVDTQNLTGYAQVVDELQNGAVTRTYSYGPERISETQTLSGTPTTSFYLYDGHGSVRQLLSTRGTVTDTYDYDAFGNLISSTGTTPNVYLFAGEQFDPALGLYYNRARYYNNSTGRFWSMDTVEGDSLSPLSLHKYLYASSNPVNRVDPNGTQDFVSEVAAEADDEILEGAESGVENAAKKQVEKELAPEILIHSTSLSNAYSIDSIGLSAQVYPDLNVPVGTRFPGAFFVFAVSTNQQYSFTDLVQAAISFAVGRFNGDLAYMVGELPQPIWQGLQADGSVIPDPLGLPGSATAYACLPPSFPVLDEFNQGRWLIVPVGK